MNRAYSLLTLVSIHILSVVLLYCVTIVPQCYYEYVSHLLIVYNNCL